MFRVLLVDDTKSVHAFVKGMLSKVENIDVTSVFNGDEAVKLLRSNQNFDLILLDWEMPVLTGPEAFTAFKEAGIKVPTVMMTTKNSPEDIRKMLDLGVAEYLMKPFTVDILFEKIEFATGSSFPYAA